MMTVYRAFLRHLTKAEVIEHSNAHDAMADVYATIGDGETGKTRQPRLFDYLFTHHAINTNDWR